MTFSVVRPVVSFGALLFGTLLGLFVVGPPTVQAGVDSLALRADALPLVRDDPAQDRVGRLRYRGGLVLSSDDRRFGGLSDMLIEPGCGHLLIVSDTGAFVTLALVEQGGRLTGVRDAHIAPIQDAAGQPPAQKSEADAEALVRTADGRIHVWFERLNRAQVYDGVTGCVPATVSRSAIATVVPPRMQAWPLNGGPEAAAPFQDGQIVLSEEVTDSQGRRVGHLLDRDGKVRADIAVAVPAGYVPTGLALRRADSEGAEYLLLLRRFSPFSGVSAVVAEIRVTPAGGTIAATEIARLIPPVSVDNMESIAIRQIDGAERVYLLSDDNFNSLQRTLLMEFDLVP